MIQNGATAAHQRPPYIYGEVLSRIAYTAEINARWDRPRFGVYMAQGAATGAVLEFSQVVLQIITVPNPYNFLFMYGLPVILAFGAGWGMVKALVIWTCAKLARRRVPWLIRCLIAGGVMTGLTRVFEVFFPQEPGPPVSLSWLAGSTISIALTCGVVIGSNLNPWRAVVRGANFIVPRSAFVAGVTGLILRLFIVWAFMGAVMLRICTTQMNSTHKDVVWASLILCHLTAALLVVFIRMPFWLLVILSTLVTAPVVRLVIEFQHKLEWGFYPVIGYLAVWIAFLLARWRPTYSALAVINDEIHYYLID
jgi:hypothetical protein